MYNMYKHALSHTHTCTHTQSIYYVHWTVMDRVSVRFRIISINLNNLVRVRERST